MDKISKSVSNILAENGIIQEEDIDKCRYGLEVFLSSVLEMLSVLIISIFVENFMETLFFFVAFVPLRIYAGGYHAETRLRCYVILLVVYALFSFIMKITPENVYTLIECFGALFTLIIVFAFAPVLHRNKNINDIEIYHYRKISTAIVLIELLVIMIGIFLFENNVLVFAFTLGQLSVSFSMITALIKKLLREGGIKDEKL